MLREIRYENLPSYEIGMERGISQGILKTAITMIKEFNLSIEQVATKLNISIDELKKHLK
jgi:predicted transposase YdaD